jgi:hypothetical protein
MTSSRLNQTPPICAGQASSYNYGAWREVALRECARRELGLTPTSASKVRLGYLVAANAQIITGRVQRACDRRAVQASRLHFMGAVGDVTRDATRPHLGITSHTILFGTRCSQFPFCTST